MFRRKLPRDHITQGQGLSEVSARLSRLMKWCPGQGSNLHAGITRRGIFVALRLSPPETPVRALDYAFTMVRNGL
jgi:hypothetical protein